MPKVKVKHVRFTPAEMACEAPAEVDFSKGLVIHGRSAWREYLARKRAFAKLDPDVRRAFPDDRAVNEALRSLIPTHPGPARRRKSA